MCIFESIMAWRLFNILTKAYVRDVYSGEIEEFTNGYFCMEHYESQCEGMLNVVIRKVKL